MKKSLGIAMILAASLAAGPKGTAPRSDAAKYPAHIARDGESIGASLLTPAQLKKDFVSDMKDYVVIEVAIYPGSPLDVSLDDFSLRPPNSDIAVRPLSPRLAAARVQRDKTAKRTVDVYPSVGVGYETGRTYDPITGQQRPGGVYTSTGVGVGVGGPSGPSDRDRGVMEMELAEQALSEGTAAAPVAGHLYFPSSAKRKSGIYELEYRLRGQKVTLKLH